MQHRQHFIPGIDEEFTADDHSHYVVTSAEAFDGAVLLAAWRQKPGVCRVMMRFGDRLMITAYCRDELLPPGTHIEG